MVLVVLHCRYVDAEFWSLLSLLFWLLPSSLLFSWILSSQATKPGNNNKSCPPKNHDDPLGFSLFSGLRIWRTKGFAKISSTVLQITAILSDQIFPHQWPTLPLTFLAGKDVITSGGGAHVF